MAATIVTIGAAEEYDQIKEILRRDYGYSWFSALLYYRQTGVYGLVAADSADEGEAYLELALASGWELAEAPPPEKGRFPGWVAPAAMLGATAATLALVARARRPRRR